MSVSEHWVRRFLGNGREKAFRFAASREYYWTAEVFDVMSDRCDDLIFLDPDEGLRCAEILVELAGRIRDLDLDRRGFSYAILGSALRKIGRYKDARESYTVAIEMISSKLLRGRVLQRFSVLEWMAGSPKLGLKIINQSMAALTGHDLGTSLVIRGSIHGALSEYTRSVEDHGLALTLLDVGSRSYFCAVRNLADSLINVRDVGAIGAALKLISKGRSMAMNLNRYKRRAPLALLNWVEGRLYCKLGSHKRGASLLGKAKKSFLSFKSFDHRRDALIVSGDLIVAFDSMGDFESSASEFEDLAERARAMGLKNLHQRLKLDLEDPSSFRSDLMDLLKGLDSEAAKATSE